MNNISDKHTLLLPLDFSEFTPYAVAHAVNYAKILDSTITLAHFLPEKLINQHDEKLVQTEKAMDKLQAIESEISSKHGIDCYVAVRTKDFHEGIGGLANEVKAGLVVMATKGIHGMQRWTGSNAIKVVLNGKEIPFVVVQEMPKNEIPLNIILPFSFESESRQKLGRVPQLSKLFDCTFHVISELEEDEFLKNKSEAAIAYVKRFLDEHECKYTVSKSSGKKAFHKELIDFGKAKEADLMIIMTEEDHEFMEFFTGSHEQEIIANEAKIPVMVLNPKETMQLNGLPMFF